MEGRLDVLFQLHLTEVNGVISSNCGAGIPACVATFQPESLCFLKCYLVHELTGLIMRNQWLHTGLGWKAGGIFIWWRAASRD